MDDKIHFVTLQRKPIYKNPCVNSELHRDFFMLLDGISGKLP